MSYRPVNDKTLVGINIANRVQDADQYTIRHLEQWFQSGQTPFRPHEENLSVLRHRMLARYDEDPELWGNRGWGEVYYSVK